MPVWTPAPAGAAGRTTAPSTAPSPNPTRRHEELAHSHRIDAGQSFDPGMSVQGSCNVPTTADWAAYDQWVGPYMDGSYWSDGVPSARLTVPFTPGASWGPEANCTAAQY